MTNLEFEQKAYSGYVSYGYSMSDGYYAPIAREQFVKELRSKVVKPGTFRYGNDFQPTQAECDKYNVDVLVYLLENPEVK